MIDQFIEAIFGDQTGNVTVALRDKPGPDGKVNQYTWFKFPEQQKEFSEFSKKNCGADLYFSPIVYGEKLNANGKIARTPENALTTQVIYADSDTARPDDYRLQPSIVVETSHHRYHCYWMLDQPISAEVASEIAHRVTTAHAAQGSDQNGWSANKVLRIPGSMNTSHGFPEQVKVHYTGNIYSDMDISGAYDNVDVTARPYMRPEAPVVAVEQPDALPDYGATLEKLSARTMELALAEPRADQDRSRLRYKLLLELARDDLTIDEVLSVAWHAPAAKKWSEEDTRGFSGLVAEAGKAIMEVQSEGTVITRTEDPDDVPEVDSEVSLLTTEERLHLLGQKNFVKRYVDHAATLTENPNAPYQRINGWTVLSAGMATTGFIPRKNGKENLCMYTMTIGDTTTGKSWERKLMMNVMGEIFSSDPDFNLGGNTSPSALGKKLIERDGKVSFLNKDEAHGAMKSWTTQDWTTGLLEDFAELYDGRVPPQLRTGNWEGSGKSATTYFLMHLMGTPKDMIAALSRDLFLSGFLARFQWAIGTPSVITYESMAEEDSEGDDIKLGFDPYCRQLATELALARSIVKSLTSSEKVAVRLDDEASQRIHDVKWAMKERFEGDRNWEILKPSIIRMGVTIRKAASLIALADGRAVVNITDMLFAIEAAEEWVSNLVTVASQISASDFERACDEIEEFVNDKGGRAKREIVMRRFKHLELRDLTVYLDALAQQHRVVETSGEKRVRYLETPAKEE